MQMSQENRIFQLDGKKQFAFRQAQGIYLECTEGKIWLTVEGQPGDFLLAKGERVRIESNGLALVQGLPSGSIRLVNEAIRSVTRQLYFAKGLLIGNQT